MMNRTMHKGSRRRGVGRALALATLLAGSAMPALAAGDAKAPPPIEWTWEGPLGTFDRAALQRGLQVYREVCMTCHALQYVSIRTFEQPGGPGFSEAEVKAIAASYEKDVIDENGDLKAVPRTPADTLPNPYANEQLARAANGGALPPDLSVITKARKQGPDYLLALLTGYADPPAGTTVREGMYYNPYFAGGQLAMAPQLTPDRVTYSDGTAATPEQMAKDVTTFLHWAAEPKLEARKRMGINVMIYLGVLTLLLYWSYRRVWRDQH